MKCNHCGHDFYGHTPTANPDVMNCPGCYGGKCARREKIAQSGRFRQYLSRLRDPDEIRRQARR
jgi:hypothetical protein